MNFNPISMADERAGVHGTFIHLGSSCHTYRDYDFNSDLGRLKFFGHTCNRCWGSLGYVLL